MSCKTEKISLNQLNVGDLIVDKKGRFVFVMPTTIPTEDHWKWLRDGARIDRHDGFFLFSLGKEKKKHRNVMTEAWALFCFATKLKQNEFEKLIFESRWGAWDKRKVWFSPGGEVGGVPWYRCWISMSNISEKEVGFTIRKP